MKKLTVNDLPNLSESDSPGGAGHGEGLRSLPAQWLSGGCNG